MRLTIFTRQNIRKLEDFSCGIMWGDHVLARYNGHNTEKHTNSPGYECKEVPPYTCHIHEATELALRTGKKLEHNAIPTDRYNDLDGALLCLVEDHNIVGIDNPNSIELL